MNKPIILLFLVFLSVANVQAQITRGASPGEIYMSNQWYWGNDGLHSVILYSADNGENITVEYENIQTPPQGEMKIGTVLGDATSGALYNYGDNELWVSFDNGENWEYREDYQNYIEYWGGVNQGVIFKGGWGKLYKSNDYAQMFELVADPPNCPISDIGIINGEFFGLDGNAGEGFFLYHTYDFANTYTVIPIDSTIAFWAPGGHWPVISKGTEPGEIYLVSWWLNSKYKIFHSVDTGYTWTQKYESDYIELYNWGVQYTAGRQPGSVYVKRSTLDPSYNHSLLYVDYSSDYGETFTTYFYDLDSLFTSVASHQKQNWRLALFPNPASTQITIESTNKGQLTIMNLSGQELLYKSITEQTTPIDISTLPNGVYFVRLKGERSVQVGKFVKN